MDLGGKKTEINEAKIEDEELFSLSTDFYSQKIKNNTDIKELENLYYYNIIIQK